MPSDPNPRSGNAGKEAEEFDGPSHNLWVGNLSSDTTESDLMTLFGKFGALDSVTTYAQRNYAFVYFKHLDDAKRAKDKLQGTLIRGNTMKIEFTRPAKPGKHLWVGGISSSVTKEQLEDEFSKFGKVDDFKFLRDRNTALVDYVRLEDAVAALKNLNGKRLGGEQLRVDYLRSHTARRQENWSDFHDPRDGHFNNRNVTGYSESMWMPLDVTRNFPDSSQFGPKKHQPPLPFGVQREAFPSNVLWIGYPPSVQIDDQMLHNAMILFGEIERIRSFPERHYSFVEFRSVDEARRAKEGLQGRLFNDPRIQILFSSSEHGSGKDNPPFFPGFRGPRPDMFFGDMPFGPMDVFRPNRPMAPNSFPPPLGPNAMPGPNMPLRPFPPQGFDPLLPNPDLFNDLAGLLQNFPEVNNLNNPMAGNWRRLSPQGMRPPPIRPGPVPGMWEGFDANPFQREPKRSRIDGPLPVDDSPFHARKMDNHVVGDPFGFGPQLDRGVSGPLVNVHGPSHHSPVGARIPSGDPLSRGEHHVGPGNDDIWRGIVAKGGTPVCHARCVPMGKGIDCQLPEIVNCSARTGLDMLTQHYSEANGFDIVFFLPDSEDDFASYTEFLRYLGVKNRAGVAKLDDGTTLFLVPPSDFLTQVLKVSGPERLYGVVLKMPQHLNSVAMQQPPQLAAHPPPPPSHYIDGHQLPSLQSDYNQVPVKEEHTLQMDYNRVWHDDSMALQGGAKPVLTHADESNEVQPVPQDYANNPAAPQLGAGVALTPELIATLAALIPANLQPPVSGNTQMPTTSSVRPPFHAPVTPDKVMPSPGWGQEPQASVSGSLHSGEEQTSHASQQLGHQFNYQSPILSQFSNFMNVANVPPAHSAQAQVAMGSTQAQGPGLNMQQPSMNMQQPATSMQQPAASMQQSALNMQHSPMNMHQPAINMQQPAIHMRPVNSFMIPSHIGQFAIPQANHQYQVDAPQDSQKNYGLGHSVDAAGVFHPPIPQQPKLISSPGPVHSGNMQPQAAMPLAADKLNADLPNQVQQLQSVLSVSGQGTSESEADKNQRYQSTLQFAANLLLQIQQQQQQANAQAVQGSGNQQ